MADKTCWLCDDLGAVAIHRDASGKLGKTLWVAHRPWSRTHQTRPCPACELRQARATIMEIHELARKLGQLS